MPKTSLAQIQGRYQITQELQSAGEDVIDGGGMTVWYNLDVGWLLGENQQLRAALQEMVNAVSQSYLVFIGAGPKSRGYSGLVNAANRARALLAKQGDGT